MPTYLYRCTGCDRQITLPSPDGGTHIGSDSTACGAELRRDWKAENVGINISNLKAARS